MDNVEREADFGSVNAGFISDAEPNVGDKNKFEEDSTQRIEKSEELNHSNGESKMNGDQHLQSKDSEKAEGDGQAERGQWGGNLQFLMSCIAMSVGLGNIWRFPFIAYENGGGAFLIPYIIVLVFIGRPIYYMEMVLGQFSGYGYIKLWNVVPAMKGVGFGQLWSTFLTVTYYCSLMALTTFYFVVSFSAELPWSYCRSEWGSICIDSKGGNSTGNVTGRRSSSELFFLKFLLNEPVTLEEGIGVPDWRLTVGSLFSWLSIFIMIVRGIKSSGKASYFLALFPYVILITLFIRGVTLPGAGQGILYFITPQWGELLNPDVWYAAVSQAFFSLSICFGSIIMYSSYNKFDHNIYRDALIVTSLDTFTSLLAGITIFSILGNLAYELGVDNIDDVIQSGSGLAFVSYPDAISKFDAVPQLFAVLFFLMLFVLGIGSAVALQNSICTIICDEFPSFKYWIVAAVTCSIEFLIGLMYITSGGQWILTLVDHYSVTLVVYVHGTIEVVAIVWIYGVDKFCQDIEFMLKRKTGIYWKISWGLITPVFLIVVLVYTLVTNTSLTYGGKPYTKVAYDVGWATFAIGVFLFPAWMLYLFYANRKLPTKQMFINSFKSSDKWGPRDPEQRAEWIKFKEMKKSESEGKINLLSKILGFFRCH